MTEETNSKGWGEVAVSFRAVNKSWKNKQFFRPVSQFRKERLKCTATAFFSLEILISFYDY